MNAFLHRIILAMVGETLTTSVVPSPSQFIPTAPDSPIERCFHSHLPSCIPFPPRAAEIRHRSCEILSLSVDVLTRSIDLHLYMAQLVKHLYDTLLIPFRMIKIFHQSERVAWMEVIQFDCTSVERV